MICDIIKKEGEKGSGGGVEAFEPGVAYVCRKATRVEMLNIAASDWRDAAAEMVLTSELSARVQKPYYHFMISWHPQENPTADQMFEAAHHMIRSLALEDQQIVIGPHLDTPRNHIHVIANTVHPLTGRVWSKSNDHMRAEKACREIELKQGWSHDRGRFDFIVNDAGEVELKSNPVAWEKKKNDRDAGKRPKRCGARKFEKSTGFVTFEHGIPDALRERFAAAVAKVRGWQGLHIALAEIGLKYYKSGSGARVGILGSEEFAKASAFGNKFSISKMETAFGDYEEPQSEYVNAQKPIHTEAVSISGTVSLEDDKATRASAFKMTLLRRIYTDIHLDPRVADAIRFVDLADPPPQLTFKDGSTVVDHGTKLSASKSTPEARGAMIAMAKAKNWSSVKLSGSPAFIRDMAIECAKAGLSVHDLPDDIQGIADELLERHLRSQRRIDAEARAAERIAHAALADRDEALAENVKERAEKTAEEEEMTREHRMLLDALRFSRAPLHTALRTVAQEEVKHIKADLPDRRQVETPQPAPDADRVDRGGIRQIAARIRENDHAELEAMKSLDIALVAEAFGWADASASHPDGHGGQRSHGRYRTYTRGANETIKCTLGDNQSWLWSCNKTGTGGSVVDLWLRENPGKTLGDARMAFREIMGTTPVAAPQPARLRQAEEPRDHTAARRRWEEAPYIGEQYSYAQARGISERTLMRFSEQVRVGAFGGIYFANRNPKTGDIQGFEQRWEKDGKANTSRFAKGGLKTVCVLGDPQRASRMIVFEGGLDALALAEIEGRDDTIYVSTGGGFGPRTEDALKSLAAGKRVYGGFDNDQGGEALQARLRDVLGDVERLSPPSNVDRSEAACKDWLDVLNALKASGARSLQAPESPVSSETAGQHLADMDGPGFF